MLRWYCMKTNLATNANSKISGNTSSLSSPTSSTSLKDFVQASSPSYNTTSTSLSTVAKGSLSATSNNSTMRKPIISSGNSMGSTYVQPKTTSPSLVLSSSDKSGSQISQVSSKTSKSLLSDLRNFRKVPLKPTSPSQHKSAGGLISTTASPTSLSLSPVNSKISNIVSSNADGMKSKLSVTNKSPSNKMSPPHLSPKPVFKPIPKPPTTSPVSTSNLAFLGSQNTLTAALNSGTASSSAGNANNIAQMAAAFQAAAARPNLGLSGVLPGFTAAQTAAIAQAAAALTNEQQKAAAAMNMLRIPTLPLKTTTNNLSSIIPTTPSLLGSPPATSSLSFT